MKIILERYHVKQIEIVCRESDKKGLEAPKC